ncbi:MAG: hypothetical protein H2049_09755 [Porphyrobacter sp.]|nr:hypothetical protein [Porphyrobacter sp.]
MKSWICAGLAAVLVVSVPIQPVLAGAKYTAQGFAFEAEQKPQVVVVRPDMFMGTLDSSNRQIPDPDWLAEAHTNLQESLKRHPAAKTVEWQFADWNDPASQPLSEGFWKTFLDLNLDIVFKVPQGSFPMPMDANLGRAVKQLPKGYHEYRLPPAGLDEVRSVSSGAQYALLIKMHDAYTTDGAKLTRLLDGMGNVVRTGTNIQAPPPHFGFSMLIDLGDGKVVWFHNDGAIGGDLRKPATADKRVAQLLTDWPMGR